MIIENLSLQRQDGRELPETGRANYIARKGWKIDKVIGARWTTAGVTRSISHDDALGISVVPGRQFLAVVSFNGPDLHASQLAVVSADGTTHLIVPNTQVIRGDTVSGFFRWAEPTQPEIPGHFIGVFEHPNSDMYRLTIAAVDGTVSNVALTR